jgi:hypothetical protein
MRLRSCCLAILLAWGGACVVESDDDSEARAIACEPGQTCECDGAGACEADCDDGDCGFVCGGSGSCELTCDAGGCDAVCEGSGSCILHCPGGDCSLDCEGSGECRLAQCSDCDLQCDGTGTCSME